MSWKKNWFSYLVWFIYAVAVGFGLVCLNKVICDSFEIQTYYGIGPGILLVILIGLGVFLIHRYVQKHPEAKREEHTVKTVVEASVAVILLAVGLILRVRGIEGAVEKAGYYEMASVTAGHSIPTLVHGAEYFYIYLLHFVYYFLGNKFSAGIWLQIAVQFAAILILYFSVRYVVGRIVSIVMLGFCMLSSYMIQASLSLSPEMLFLFFWTLVFGVIIAGYKGKLSPVHMLFHGMLISLVTYVDITGLLLAVLTIAVIFCNRNSETKASTRMIALVGCVFGFFVGFTGCIFADACLSGKEFAGVLGAWLQLFKPELFRIPVSLGTNGFPLEYIILYILLTAGVFSFWCDKRLDYRKAWILGTIILMTADCFGIFTDSVPGSLLLYLFITLLAGISLQECILGRNPVTEEERKPVTETEPLDEKNNMQQRKRDYEKEDEPMSKVQFIENPLPLPKKHEKRVLRYDVENINTNDDFDITVDDNDDFDI